MTDRGNEIPSRRPTTPPEGRPGSEPITVLHVEDDRSFREFLGASLSEESERISVVSEADVESGLSRLEAGDVDFVVSDYVMEGLDGLEFLARVREAHDDLPFVMLTATGSEEVASDATALGVTSYLLKGPDPDRYVRLADLVERTVDSRRAEEMLAATQQKYRSLVEAAPDAIFLADAETGVLLEANPAAAELLGRPAEEVVGLPYTELLPDGMERRYRELFSERFLTDGSVASRFPDGSPIEVERADGERVPAEINASVLELDDRTLVQVIFRDVSERREREREMRRQNERLEEFADVVAHDLRNPLNVASLAAAMLPEEAPDVERLRRALERMETIVEDVLALAKQGRSVDERERVDLARLAGRAWAMAETGGAELVVETQGELDADPDRLQTLLENLFRNSVEHGSTGSRAPPDDRVEHGSTGRRAPPDDSDEHGSTGSRTSTDDGADDGGKPDRASPDFYRNSASTPRGAPVSVRVGDLPDGFYVEDDGPGIPAADREQVFEMGVTSTDDGTGFGLAIVHRIAEAHGWAVDVTAGRDGGARFEFTDVARPDGPTRADT